MIYNNDDDDDFGLIELDDSYEDLPPTPEQPCRSPSNHIFEKKLLARHYYHECTVCGYSPDLDANKPKFQECHEKYLSWKKR